MRGLVCHAFLTEFQTFCHVCRSRVALTRESHTATRSRRMKRVWDYFRNALLAPEDRGRFTDAMRTAEWNPERAATSLEHLAGGGRPGWFTKRVRDLQATFYVAAGEDKGRELLWSSALGAPTGIPPLLGLTNTARRIVLSVHKLRTEGAVGEAEDELNEALDGTLALFWRARWKRTDDPQLYSCLGRLYVNMSQRILVQAGIIPLSTAARACYEGGDDSQWVRCGSHILGLRISAQIPEFEFGEEIIWLYEQAQESYNEALRHDATDTKSYLELSRVQKQLSQFDEDSNSLATALAILNGALLASGNDWDSRFERAEVLTIMGDIPAAKSDLKAVQSQAQDRSKRDLAKRRLEDLNKPQTFT